MKVAVVGGAGFIGSHFCDLVLEHSDVTKILVIDKLTYAGNLENLSKSSNDPRFDFLKSDLNESEKYETAINNFDIVINFAAESHVDKSIFDPKPFFETNSLGVATLAACCINNGVKRLVQVSTDEVYGPIKFGTSDEKAVLNPSSPYSSSKAAGELFALSFWKTFGFPVVVTRGSNTYGPRQYPEKLIPLALTKLRKNEKIPVYGSGKQIREWTHVIDHAHAIWLACKKGESGAIYNIGSGERYTNLELLAKLLKSQGKDLDSIEFVGDRLGHDYRYALNSKLISKKLGWKPKYNFTEALAEVSSW